MREHSGWYWEKPFLEAGKAGSVRRYCPVWKNSMAECIFSDYPNSISHPTCSFAVQPYHTPMNRWGLFLHVFKFCQALWLLNPVEYDSSVTVPVPGVALTCPQNFYLLPPLTLTFMTSTLRTLSALASMLWEAQGTWRGHLVAPGSTASAKAQHRPARWAFR